MAKGDGPILTNQQLGDYEWDCFFTRSRSSRRTKLVYYRTRSLRRPARPLAVALTRLDALHLFFSLGLGPEHTPASAELSREQLLGPNIVLKSARG